MANDFLKVKDADLSKYAILSTEAVNDLKTRTIDGVKVLDYGQGDCNAIVQQDNKPILFFDMGGGKHTGSRTHPWHTGWSGNNACATRMVDVSLKPTVVLSHWDGDHYSTGWYITNAANLTTKTVPANPPAVKDLQWLVPRQCKHPSKLEFVSRLTNVRCFPANKTHRFNLNATTDVVIESCTGSTTGEYDPNLDGLAVRLERIKAGGDPTVDGDVIARIVLPGDAPYQFIPSCAGGPPTKVVGLLAFHHGSETHLDQNAIAALPAAKDNTATIGYTFGLKPDGSRCYGHPSKKAITEYQNAGKDWPAANRVCPSGGFANWPPDAGVTSTQQNNRADQSLTLTAAPVVQQVALRRSPRLRQ